MQNQKLMKLDEKLNKIESLNKRTSKFLRTLGASMAADWLHLTLVILIVVNLIFLIILVAVFWDELVVTVQKQFNDKIKI
jgi:hypothetical protein